MARTEATFEEIATMLEARRNAERYDADVVRSERDALRALVREMAAHIERVNAKLGGDGIDGTLGWWSGHPLLEESRALLARARDFEKGGA